jgi:hypothetical protein
MDIYRLLPKDQYDAAINANSPSATNAFATILDLSGITNIYNNDGTIGSTRSVGITDSLKFGSDLLVLDEINRRVGINKSVPTAGFHVLSINEFGSYFDGYSTSPSEYIMKLRNFDGTNYTELNRFRNNGKVELCLNNPNLSVGNAYNNTIINSNSITSNALNGGNGANGVGFVAKNNANSNNVQIGFYSNKFGRSYISSTHDIIFTNWVGNDLGSFTNGAEAMRIGNNTMQGVSIGTNNTSLQKFLVRGSGNSNSTILARFQALAGNDLITFYNGGSISIGATLSANQSLLEVNGDVEIVDSTKGFIVHDRNDGNRYRIFTTNGILNTEIA